MKAAKTVTKGDMLNVLVFGDSIAYGAWDDEGGWVQRLREFLEKKYKTLKIYNFSIPGDTSLDIVKRFEKELVERKVEKGDVIIFAIGINDSHTVEGGASKVSPDKFRENISTLLSFTKNFVEKVVFVGLTPVDERLTEKYFNEKIKSYDKIIQEVCKDGAEFVELFNYLSLFVPGILKDGLHPNSRGHEKIFERVREKLGAILLQSYSKRPES